MITNALNINKDFCSSVYELNHSIRRITESRIQKTGGHDEA